MISAQVPEGSQCRSQAQSYVNGAVKGPVQRRTQIVVFRLQAIGDCRPVPAQKLRFGLLRDHHVVVRMVRARQLCLAALLQTFPGILADRLEHCEARLTTHCRLLKETLVD